MGIRAKDLPDTGSLSGSDKVLVDNGSSTRSKTLTELATFIGGGGASVHNGVEDPTVTSDGGIGFVKGSLWSNTISGDLFICADATVGAAVWKNIGSGGTVDFTSVNAALAAADAAVDLNGQDFSAGSATVGAALIEGNFRVATPGFAKLEAAFYLQGVMSPTALAADQTDYAPTGSDVANVLRLSASSSARTLRSLDHGDVGRLYIVQNVGTTYPVVLAHEYTSGTTAAMRFSCPGRESYRIAPGECAVLAYDGTSSRWRVLSHAKRNRVFDIREYGALDSPNDIGPSVAAAFVALVANGGGTVFVPPREDGLNGNRWKWTTLVDSSAAQPSDLLDGMSAWFVGTKGQTFIEVGIGQNPLCEIGHSNAIVGFDGLTFVGEDANGINAPYILRIRQARLGIVKNCAFYSLGCDQDGFGLVRIVADSTHVEDCIFMGCGYFGTLVAGGTLSIEGARDSCTVANCRFMVMDGNGFNANTRDKSSTSVGTHLWFGDQGASPTTGAAGTLLVDCCQFDANALVLIFASGVDDTRIDRIRIRDCSFLGASNNNPAVYARAMSMLVEGCKWGNFSNTQVCVGFRGGRLVMRDCRYATSCGHTITFFGATEYVELDNCDAGFTFDTGTATPTDGIVRSKGTVLRPFGGIVSTGATTLALSDAHNGKVIRSSANAGITITVPDTLSPTFECKVYSTGSPGGVTFTPSGTMSLTYPGAGTVAARFAMTRVTVISATEAVIEGCP